MHRTGQFYNSILDDGRVKCPGCGDALNEVEKIDDDIEATGYIQVRIILLFIRLGEISIKN